MRSVFGFREGSPNQLVGSLQMLLGLVVVSLFAVACGQDASGGAEDSSNVEIPDRATGLLPADWLEYSIIDVGRLLDEGETSHLDEFGDSWGSALDQVGVLAEEVEVLAEVRGELAEYVLVVQGGLDFDAVRDQISDFGMEEGEYRGFELWQGGGLAVGSEVALIEDGGFALIGSGGVTSVLRGLSRRVGLLAYEDESGVLQLLDRVGDGWNRQVWTGKDCLDIGVQRCEGVAWSVTPAGSGDVDVTWALIFRDERSVRMELGDVEDIFADIESLEVHDLDSDGRLIVVKGILEDHDWQQDGDEWASMNMAQSAARVAPAPAQPPPPPVPAATTVPPPPPVPATNIPPRRPLPATKRLTEPSVDRDALIALYDSTGGEDWLRDDNWLRSDLYIDTWYGVTVDPHGRVSQLVLPENGLAGELPPELGTLTGLVNLSLQDNRLTGNIPHELGNLPRLRILGLYYNDLEGELPSELADLSQLMTLYLGGNRLSGEIPAWLGDLDDLANLNLSNNRLTGEIPPALADLPLLRWLALSGNPLTGCIPARLKDVESTDLHMLELSFC